MSIRVPPRGTRGVMFPKLPSWLASFFSRLQRSRFRRKRGGKTGGAVQSLILESTRARTGETRFAMLGFLEESAAWWLIIASLAGTARRPGWLHNLAKNPDASVEFGDCRRVAGAAATLHGPDLEEARNRIGADAPEYVRS